MSKLGVEHVTEGIAQKVEGEDREGDGQARKHRHPPVSRQVGVRVPAAAASWMIGFIDMSRVPVVAYSSPGSPPPCPHHPARTPPDITNPHNVPQAAAGYGCQAAPREGPPGTSSLSAAHCRSWLAWYIASMICMTPTPMRRSQPCSSADPLTRAMKEASCLR